MEQNISNIDHLILLFLNKEISASELQVLHEWVYLSAENKAYFKSFQTAWRQSGKYADPHRFNASAGYEEFTKRINSNIKEKTIPFRRLFTYAASILLAFLVGNVVTGIQNKTADVPLLTYSVEAPLASKLKVNLPDGSVVWLNAGSSLTYDNQFNIQNRNIQIEGEGYFDIAHNKDCPFIVKSGTSQIRVLGTKFNLKDYADDNLFKVTLLEGKIEYLNSSVQQPVLLAPNQMISYNKTTRLIKKEQVRACDSNGWINGNLILNQEKLGDIAKVLERSFDVKFVFEKATLKDLRFYGDLTIEADNLNEIMEVMTATNKFNYCYGVNNKEILIKP